MNAPLTQALEQERITFRLNGEEITAFAHETIIQAADRAGVAIPRLCYKPGMRPDGNCRACMVEIKGERVLAPSCCRRPVAAMEVASDSARALHAQKMIVELLASDMPAKAYRHDSELAHWQRVLGVGKPRFDARPQPAADLSHPAMAVNLDACIQCTRCIRACREEQVNDVIGYAFRGAHSKIVFDLDDPMGLSTCVACGECVQACPTGALAPAHDAYLVPVDRTVASVCPYCGVGCQLTYHVKDNRIVRVEGRDGPANHERLCVKGRFGFDYAHHPQRLTRPLIRKPGMPKSADFTMDPANVLSVFREASWDEALELAGGTLKRIRDERGSHALAGFGSAKGSNEEAYLFQKLVRTGFGSNNVDHCTRLCHASSVAALMEGIGSGAVTAPFTAALDSDVIIVIGARPTENDPVAATFFKQAAKRGAKVFVMDPRGHTLVRHATATLRFNPGRDVAMLNALLHTIIEEGLTDRQYIQAHTEDYEKLREHILDYSPEKMAPICGIDAATLRYVARAYARAERAIIFWGMGISQHTHGTDNARCLIALAMITGQVGLPGTGLHPLRGQNNVQGASDAGLVPMFFPDYVSVESPDVRARYETAWGTTLDPKKGLTVVEIMDAVHRNEITGMYIMGENPAMSDPDLNHARAALAHLEHLVVQDIFLTETAAYADVILPASAWPEKDGTVTNTNRQVQMGRQALPLPGEAKVDWWIIQEIARRIGLPWSYRHPSEIYTEMASLMPALDNISWDRIERESATTYPSDAPDKPGHDVVFGDRFPTQDGRGKLVPARILPPDERPDAEYPFVLSTGRQLEHWHTGAMTRRAATLDALEPGAVASVSRGTIAGLGIEPGDMVRVTTRRGAIELAARQDDAIPDGVVFIPFAFVEAAANLLTNPALDPFGKIPEFKYCAAKVERIEAAERVAAE